LDGKDPFQILNLPNFTTDKKEIKRAYRRMAMKYHPDVVLDKNSSDEDRKRASENFAKINAAYEILSGKRSGGGAGSNSSSERSSRSGSGGWDPPHRRTSSYGSRVNNNNKSDFDWNDFMSNEYKKEQEQYDAGGDSFSAIFSDLLKSGAASMSGSSSSGEGGILKDLVEFLESTVDGFSSGNYDAYDPTIQDLLIYGSIEEIKEEMEDTELLVQQLEKKLSDLVNEQEQYSDFSSSSQDPNISFVQKMEMEERKEEIQARKKVVDGYLTKARGRLLRLQNRYRELRVGSTGSRSSSSNYNDYDNDRDSFSSSYSAGTSTTDDSSRSSSSSYSTTTSTDNSNDDEKSWRRESFGSSGRGRGRRTRQRPSSSPSTSSYRDTSPPRPNNNPSPPSQSPRRQPQPEPATPSQRTNDASKTLINRQTDWDATPPHRRTSSQSKTMRDSKKRLRELQVEDEFEKLKRDLGM